jgi:hypothetical protein
LIRSERIKFFLIQIRSRIIKSCDLIWSVSNQICRYESDWIFFQNTSYYFIKIILRLYDVNVSINHSPKKRVSLQLIFGTDWASLKALNGPDWSGLKSNLRPDWKIASIRSGPGCIKNDNLWPDWTRPVILVWSGPVL